MRRNHLWLGTTLGLALAACRADAVPTPDTGTAVAPTATAPSEAPPATPEPKAEPAEPTLAKTTAVAEEESDPAKPEPAVAAPEAKPDEPATPPTPKKVLILGDSLAATGFGALLERKLDAHPDIECGRKGKSASGLARPDFFDWPAEAKKQIEAKKPELVVVIMGGNDGQDMTPAKKKGKRTPWSDVDAWKADYRTRMDAFLGEVVSDDRKVLWLGLPTMGLRSLEKKLEMIREIQKEAVEAQGDRASYLDTAPFVTDDKGELLTEAKVKSSKKAQPIRAEDRIHFTMSGSEYFAEQVYPEVLKVLGVDDAPTAK
ncbi:MAG TPA: DUF459 domain-containing protein [Nannocystaceae bacterium]|nr:DUF459 domain-containing protein [Nannocystaceae bacterium]